MKRLLTLLQSCLLLLCVLLVLSSCARERARTDIALEMTDEDSVEAIIDQDLLTAGSTIVNIEEDAGLPDKSTVTYVDRVDMQKPVLVETGAKIGDTSDEMVDLDDVEFGAETVSYDEPVIDVAVDTSDDVLLGNVDQDAADASETLVVEPVADETISTEVDQTGSSEELVETDTTTDTSLVQPTTEDVYTSVKTSVSYPRHTVKRGDTLWSISRDYNCSISELCAANNVSRRDILRVGQSLVIPKLSSKASTTVTETTEVSGVETTAEKEETTVTAPNVETEYYTVQSGDSYWKISRAYGISVDELMALNDTSSDFLKIGQKILVPKK
jgi:LysM repeat protein